MKEIGLIAFDLDETLLHKDKSLSERNKAALEECARRGIHIVPCTGRFWKGIPDCVKEIAGIRYAITMNGAIVVDVAEGRELSTRRLPTGVTLEIIELAKQFHTMYDVYMNDTAYINRDFMQRYDEFRIPDHMRRMIASTRNPVDDLTATVRAIAAPADKLNYFFAEYDERLRAKEALLKRDDVVVSASYQFNLEINAPGATKGEAILRLAQYLGLDPAATMGIGDGENDTSMMIHAGFGVAMGNAVDEVKEKAAFITGTNDDDGLAQAVERFALGGG